MAPAKSNKEVLTRGKNYLDKKAQKYGADEIVFDKESRKDFLTGFHKRKLKRQQQGKKIQEEKERLQRVEERRLLREEKKKDIERQVKEFNDTMRNINKLDNEDEGEDDEEKETTEWGGFEDEINGDQQQNQENEDSNSDNSKSEQEDHLQNEIYKLEDTPEHLLHEQGAIGNETTVSIESLDNPAISDLQKNIDLVAKRNNVNLSASERVLQDSVKRASDYAVLCGVAKPQKKKTNKKFRYLTAGERRANNLKAKAKSTKSKKRR